MLDNEKLRERLSAIVRGRRAGGIAGEAAASAAAEAEGRSSGVVPEGTFAYDILSPAHFAATSPAEIPGLTRGRGNPSGTTPLDLPSGEQVASEAATRTGVEAFLSGGEWRNERGAVYVHERLRSEIEKPQANWGRLGTPPETEPDLVALVAAGLSRALFLDLETGGLSTSPVFLAGTMHWNGEAFVMRQYFARHYGEEAPLLGALAEQARGFEFLVTYNGKSYDAPFLRGRAVTHGVAMGLPPRHVDLLHIARRRWKADLPDCRLQTLERHVCRRWRSGDVPSDEVPGLYHDFVRDGDPWRLIPVFHHNMLDVITMGEILQELCAPPRTPRRTPGVPARA